MFNLSDRESEQMIHFFNNKKQAINRHRKFENI